jgi:hypothetical protein
LVIITSFVGMGNILITEMLVISSLCLGAIQVSQYIFHQFELIRNIPLKFINNKGQIVGSFFDFKSQLVFILR